jgi:hypothetical protein
VPELQADELDERFTNDVEVDARVGDFVQFQWEIEELIGSRFTMALQGAFGKSTLDMIFKRVGS